MGKINYGRVILGGIVAGIVGATLNWFFNGVLLGRLWAETLTALRDLSAFSERTHLFYTDLFLIFIIGGIVAVWMYAAIRPRFGAGVRTAVYAGMATWVLSALLPGTIYMAGGVYGRRLTLYSTLFAIVEAVVGTIAGAALYKESEFTAAHPAAAEARPATR